jgi:hypothetical protein
MGSAVLGPSRGWVPYCGPGSLPTGFGVLAAVPLTIRSQTGEARLVIGSVARRDAGARCRGRDWLVERKPRP